MSESDRGPSLGTYKGKEVPEWIWDKTTERRFYYVRNIGNADTIDLNRDMRHGEVVISPGLIYADTGAAAQFLPPGITEATCA